MTTPMTPESLEREMAGEGQVGHTPGPWLVEVEAEPDDGDPPSIYVVHPNTVCDATVVATMGRSWNVGTRRKLADARLIADAPGLLASLKGLIGDLEYYVDDDDENELGRLEAAKALVQRIEGTAP